MARPLLLLLLALGGCPQEEDPPPPELTCFEQAPEPATRTCFLEPEPWFDFDEPLPLRLADTGCFDAGAPAPELVRFEVASPLWTDGSSKRRWLLLPPGGQAVDLGERWDLPVGSVVFKEFAGDGGPIETRVLLRTPVGWRADTYRWAGGEALRLDEAQNHEVSIGGERLDWLFPGRDDCGTCHGSPALLLGPSTAQLNRDVCVDGVVLGQLDHLADRGLIGDVSGEGLPDPADPTLPLAARARAWLHANCAHCHRPGGWTPPELTMDLRYETSLRDTRTCGVGVQYWVGPTEDAVRIRPGDPDDSHLFQRLSPGERGAMPPLGTTRPDPLGLAVVGRWIEALDSCP